MQSLPPIRIEPLEPRHTAHRRYADSARVWRFGGGVGNDHGSGDCRAIRPSRNAADVSDDPDRSRPRRRTVIDRYDPSRTHLRQLGLREIIVLLDWSDVAGSLPFGGYHRTTQDCGTAVANQFLMPYSIPDLATPLASSHRSDWSQPRRIAHQRDGGVLGEHGLWVDQATYLDPHPVDGIRDPFNISFGDAAMKVYDNVQYADDFSRTAGDTSLDFTGEPVTGAYNLQLSESILSNGGYSIQHSDTHLWYNGTIGPPFSDTDGGATIGTGWYDPPQGPRDQVGWHMSRLAGGTPSRRGSNPLAHIATRSRCPSAAPISGTTSKSTIWSPT